MSRPDINRKRSVVVAKKRTSVSLEDTFWFSLQAIVQMEDTTIEKFIERVQGHRQTPNLSSNLRIAILEYFQRMAASSLGGHGNRVTSVAAPLHSGVYATSVI